MEGSVALAPPSLRLAVATQRARYPNDDEVLERLFRNLETMRPTLWEIACSVSELYNLSLEELTGGDQHAHVVLPRQIYCYLAHKYTRLSMKRIGGGVGLQDHTSVRHAIIKIGKIMLGIKNGTSINPALLSDDLDLLRLKISEKVLVRITSTKWSG